MTIQTKASEQYFPVVIFIMLHKVVLSFEPVDETLKCDHSHESSLSSTFLVISVFRNQLLKCVVYYIFVSILNLGAQFWECNGSRVIIRLCIISL